MTVSSNSMDSSAGSKTSKGNELKQSNPLNEKLDGYLRSARAVMALSGSQAKLLAGFTAATGAALAMAPAADADIVYSGVQNITLTKQQGPNDHFTFSTSFDMDGNGNDFQMRLNGNYYFGSSMTTYGTYSFSSRSVNARLIGQGGAGVGIAGGFARNFSSGSNIGTPLATAADALLARTNSSAIYGPFYNVTGFLGVQLASGNFGWIQVSITNPAIDGGTYTVIDWAYEDSGASIVAGEVPEPSAVGGLALLALGYAGVNRYRRRRKDEAAEKTEV
ncbi:MAG: PEP-CTERM sorting domain-containing protein [Pirellulaceae bacterium]